MGSSIAEGFMGVVIGLVMGIIANSILIWILANFIVNLGDKSPFKKCIGCALALGLVSLASYACLLIPLPLINFVIAIVVWYKGSIAAIEGSLEATKGGFTILLLCTIVSFALSFWQRSASMG